MVQEINTPRCATCDRLMVPTAIYHDINLDGSDSDRLLAMFTCGPCNRRIRRPIDATEEVE